MAEVIEINDVATLGEHRMAFQALWAETPGASFFQTFDWLRIYWDHFGQDQKLRVLVVKAAGKPIGIVPLCVRRQRHRVGELRTLCYPLDGWGNAFGPLGLNQSATLTMAMRHVASTPRDWDRIQLDWVQHDTSDRGRTARAMRHAGLAPQVEAADSSSIVDTAGGWEGYLATRSPKTRHELRRHLRRIEEIDGAEFHRFRPAPLRCGDGDPHWHAYEQCEQIAEQSWQSNVDDGNTLGHPRYKAFYHDTHAAAARLGMVDMNLLSIHGRPAAFSYNYHCEGRVIGLRMGFDPEYHRAGVGAGLLALMLRDSCERGDQSLELGAGGQDFKRRLQTRTTESHTLTHTPLGSWRSQAVRLGRWIRSRSAV
ncbi:MAG: GNAT family N-acetyltransferase [Planctomycetales bacterium]|nr:GNAT family N-acetyltransferase [Planctomycetales bacterium]